MELSDILHEDWQNFFKKEAELRDGCKYKYYADECKHKPIDKIGLPKHSINIKCSDCGDVLSIIGTKLYNELRDIKRFKFKRLDNV